MKKIKQLIISILPILIILFSCNYGSESGSDLVGKWKASNDEYITFCDDNTGYYEYYNGDRGNWSWKDFKWDVEYINGSKNIVLSGEFKNQYQYYFSDDYESLYLKQHDKVCYQKWSFFMKK